MKGAFAKQSRHLLGQMLLIIPIISIYTTTYVPIIYARELNSAQLSTSCSRQSAPDAQSLLVILVGKTVHSKPNASDDEIVSSVEMLANLWPGILAVIAANGVPSLLASLPFSVRQQPTGLQQKLENGAPGKTLFLDPALKSSEDLLQQAQFPAGSRILAITHDSDDSAQQIQDIESKVLPPFAQQCIPVDTIFVSSNGYRPNALLSTIARNTYATYNIAYKPSDLVAEVLNLSAQWQGMSFIHAQPLQPTSHNDLITVDKFITRISIIAFHPDAANEPVLIGPDRQPVRKGTQTLQGLHYNFTIADHLQPGTYIVNTGSANTTQVWSLIQSPLQLQIVQPGLATSAQADQTVALQARFINNTAYVTPQAGSVQMPATVSLLGDQLSQVNTIELTQKSLKDGSLASIFQGGTTAYHKAGELRIEIQGTYNQASRQAYLTIWLTLPSSSATLQQRQLGFPPPPSLYFVLIVMAILFFLLGGTAKGFGGQLKKSGHTSR